MTLIVDGIGSRRSPLVHRGARAGFTVVEVTVLATILVVGVLGMLASVVAGMQLSAVNRETAIAHEAARSMIERMQTTQFNRIFATYNTAPADDPGGAGTAPGGRFAVAGLTPIPGDADGMPGDVFFPTITVGGVLRLSENVTDLRWGMPRDLNGDGAVTNGAMPGSPMVLPVRVEIRWRGSAGDRTLGFDHVFIQH